MRVTINHEQKTTGLVFKKTKHAVVHSIQFSEEELATIKTRKLKSTVVMERKWDATMREKAAAHPEYYDTVPPPNLTVGDLLKGDTYVCDTPVEAKRYEAQLIECLKTVKPFIEGNQSSAQSKSFEL